MKICSSCDEWELVVKVRTTTAPTLGEASTLGMAGGLPASLSDADLGLCPGTRPLGKHTRRGLTSSYSGIFASTKCLGLPRFESLLERDFHTLLCCDFRVSRYAIQSHQLTYFTPNNSGTYTERLYTPDFVVRLATGKRLIIEVKAEAFTVTDYWRSREPYIRDAYFRDFALDYIVVTERRIRIQPRLSNLKIMLRYGGRHNDPAAVLAVSEAFTLLQPVSRIGDVCDIVRLGANKLSRAYSAVMCLALRGRITLDLDQPLSLASAITRKGDDV
jgi:hypothetical protein